MEITEKGKSLEKTSIYFSATTTPLSLLTAFLFSLLLLGCSVLNILGCADSDVWFVSTLNFMTKMLTKYF